MTRGFNASNLLAYDYAISGNNITGFTSQVEAFMSTAGQRPAATPWTADNSVFSKLQLFLSESGLDVDWGGCSFMDWDQRCWVSELSVSTALLY